MSKKKKGDYQYHKTIEKMSVFDQMLARYEVLEDGNINPTYEVMQEIILAGLYRGGFFNKAAFYGGNCLRIFHGMKRFSEDMDFPYSFMTR